ncbi:MAG: 2OG-Fe(II) oxygenase [Alphaproteobacteria bacterium]
MATMAPPQLTPGDPAPWFKARTAGNPSYDFSSVAGRTIVLCLFGSAGQPEARAALDGFLTRGELFDDDRLVFFGVSVDANDERLARVANSIPGVRFFWDFERAISRLYGACGDGPEGGGAQLAYHPFTAVLDDTMRVLALFPLRPGEDHAARVLGFVAGLPAPGAEEPARRHAPVLVVPRVFEPEFCRELIAYYESHGGEDSGFMREKDGKTVSVTDHDFKRRRDCTIEDEAMRRAAMFRVHRRLVPEIAKAFNFNATRMERYIVACYEADPGGYFRPHRDNTTAGTAHRRFAVTINLNAEAYEGGDLRFPEYGRARYRAPTGGAVVFGCSLLHEALPVTRGRRFAFLPFLYDEAAARQRERNNPHLGEGVKPYRATSDGDGSKTAG